QDRDGVAVGDLGLQPTGEPHVLVVDVDVDAAMQLVVLHQPGLDPAVPRLDVVDHLEHRFAPGLDGLLPTGVPPQAGGNGHGAGHWVTSAVLPESAPTRPR